MDFIDNCEPDSRLNEIGYLSANQTITLIKDLAEAMDQIHQLGFTHNDIHLANIYSEDQGGTSFLLGDLGSVKKLTRTDGVTILRDREGFTNTVRCLLLGKELDNLCVAESGSAEELKELREYYLMNWPLNLESIEISLGKFKEIEVPNSVILDELLVKNGYPEKLITLLHSFDDEERSGGFTGLALEIEKALKVGTSSKK